MATRTKKPTQTSAQPKSKPSAKRSFTTNTSLPAQNSKPQVSISEPIIDRSYKLPSKPVKSYIHSAYCYTILGVSVVALAFGIFNVARAFIVKNYYPSIDDYTLLVQDQCKFQYTLEGQKELNDEEKKNCIDQEKSRSNEQKLRNYQRETIQGSLIIIIAVISIIVHNRLLK
jgi:hypothetical protein